MSNKLQNLISSFFELLESSIHVLSGIWQLAKLEFELAKRSLIAIIVCAIIAFLLINSIWGFLLAGLVYGLVVLKFSLVWALVIGFSLDIILLLMVALLLKKYLGDISFKATRRQLKNLTNYEKD